MMQGDLSQYFTSVAVKRLRAVEVNRECSNQHEFNGVAKLREMFGTQPGRKKVLATFLYMDDSDAAPLTEEVDLTWYDSRERGRLQGHAQRSEFRLYPMPDLLVNVAREGDLIVFARKKNDESVLAVCAKEGSTAENQLLWLFGFSSASEQYLVRQLDGNANAALDYAKRSILSVIGIEVEENAPCFLEEMLKRFGGVFPKTAEFSSFARGTLPDVLSRDNPDAALVAWMEREELLFKTLERHILKQKLEAVLKEGFRDPEPVIEEVKSALQRRRSRAGYALENHIVQIFQDYGLRFSRTPVTENNLKPDFILPDISSYRDGAFPAFFLTMLASKSTCKDRWRQILNEAERIPLKHLLTLEPGISENQTSEMVAEQVQLVLPRSVHESYARSQRSWLMDIASFLDFARERQDKADARSQAV